MVRSAILVGTMRAIWHEIIQTSIVELSHLEIYGPVRQLM